MPIEPTKISEILKMGKGKSVGRVDGRVRREACWPKKEWRPGFATQNFILTDGQDELPVKIVNKANIEGLKNKHVSLRAVFRDHEWHGLWVDEYQEQKQLRVQGDGSLVMLEDEPEAEQKQTAQGKASAPRPQSTQSSIILASDFIDFQLQAIERGKKRGEDLGIGPAEMQAMASTAAIAWARGQIANDLTQPITLAPSGDEFGEPPPEEEMPY